MPEKLRGTYAGLASEPAIRHLQELGVTAVELLPVHYHVDDRHLVEQGAGELLGLQHARFFAPDNDYASPRFALDAVREFKTMVRNLHAAGIEVILDVVYNHTAEGNQMGPTLSFRGIDNASYYRLSPEDPRYYMDFTGCGNTLNMQNPRVLQLIMDSLRYWVIDMHVDGFRFDLASTLARELHDVDKLGAFFDIIHQDPVISQVKLIAEPWDLGEGGYQVGNFPGAVVGMERQVSRLRPPLLERRRRRGVGIRHAVLRLQRSVRMERPPAARQHQLHHLPRRLHAARSGLYDHKHNEANGEENRDGANDNISWNCGAEGPTDDPEDSRTARTQETQHSWPRCVLARRADAAGRRRNRPHAARQQQRLLPGQRNHLARLEFERSQKRAAGVHASADAALFRAAGVSAPPILSRRRSWKARAIPDILWLDPNGKEMTEEAWDVPFVRCLGVQLFGKHVDVDEHGEPINGDTLLILFNADQKIDIPFVLPAFDGRTQWQRLLDTADPKADERNCLPLGKNIRCDLARWQFCERWRQNRSHADQAAGSSVRRANASTSRPPPLATDGKAPAPQAAARQA